MQEFAIQNYTRKCARESTVLGTLTLASGSTPCLFGGHGRATLSAKGTQPDYARIMITRLSEVTLLFCSALVREKTQTWKAEPSECPPANVTVLQNNGSEIAHKVRESKRDTNPVGSSKNARWSCI